MKKFYAIYYQTLIFLSENKFVGEVLSYDGGVILA